MRVIFALATACSLGLAFRLLQRWCPCLPIKSPFASFIWQLVSLTAHLRMFKSNFSMDLKPSQKCLLRRLWIRRRFVRELRQVLSENCLGWSFENSHFRNFAGSCREASFSTEECCSSWQVGSCWRFVSSVARFYRSGFSFRRIPISSSASIVCQSWNRKGSGNSWRSAPVVARRCQR